MSNLEYLQEAVCDRDEIKRFLLNLLGDDICRLPGDICGTTNCPAFNDGKCPACSSTIGVCTLEDDEYVDIWLNLEKENI